MVMATVFVLGMSLAQTRPPVAQVKMHHGAPALFINGTPNPATSYMTYAPAGDNFMKMGQAGVHLYSFSTTPTQCPYNLAPLCWKGPEQFDYANMDERARLLLSNDPDAYFFPRAYLGTPPWWAEAHPDDLVQSSPAEGGPRVFSLHGNKVASWASERWREDTAEALRRFIRHVEQSPYADRVIGYHLASGTTEEWMQWGSNENEWADYCPVNAARFRKWLKGKYATDSGLQRAWNDPAATLDTAAIPPRAARAASELGYLRDPARAGADIDYVLYTSWLAADTIKYFSHAIKEETHHERLTGVFYGYVLQLAGEAREQISGHLALNEVFSCPDIDFITSPTSYAFRQLGTGFPHAMSLVDSIKFHGKLWFDENDIRTWLTPNVKVGDFGKTATYEESLLAQQREFAWVLSQRLGMWWFDMGGGWYDDPRMLSEIGKMHRIAQSCLGVDASSVAEIAWVVDGKSSAYLRPGNPFSGEALVQQLPELGRIGAPFATVDLTDLKDLPRYKLYIFPNCFAPTDKERREIETIRRSGAAIVWMGPAGLYRNGVLDPSAMNELVGMSLQLLPAGEPWRVQPTADAANWGWANAATFGSGRAYEVVAIPSAEQLCKVLGVKEGSTQPALVADVRDGAVVFSAVPRLPAGLLRAIARKAGVHLYIDTEDIVWASHDLLAISVNRAGARTVHLPQRRTVVDLWSGKTIGEGSDHFVVELPEKSTALLQLR